MTVSVSLEIRLTKTLGFAYLKLRRVQFKGTNVTTRTLRPRDTALVHRRTDRIVSRIDGRAAGQQTHGSESGIRCQSLGNPPGSGRCPEDKYYLRRGVERPAGTKREVVEVDFDRRSRGALYIADDNDDLIQVTVEDAVTSGAQVQ